MIKTKHSLLFIPLLALLAITSCKKDSGTANKLVGTWVDANSDELEFDYSNKGFLTVSGYSAAPFTWHMKGNTEIDVTYDGGGIDVWTISSLSGSELDVYQNGNGPIVMTRR